MIIVIIRIKMIITTKISSNTDNIKPFDYEILTRNKFITKFWNLSAFKE